MLRRPKHSKIEVVAPKEEEGGGGRKKRFMYFEHFIFSYFLIYILKTLNVSPR